MLFNTITVTYDLLQAISLVFGHYISTEQLNLVTAINALEVATRVKSTQSVAMRSEGSYRGEQSSEVWVKDLWAIGLSTLTQATLTR